MIALLLKLLTSKFAAKLAVEILTQSVPDEATKVDSKLVRGVVSAFAGEDSGLQRKPTGPRKKR